MTLTEATVLDEGGLWELGIAFPLSNPKMERFERYYRLSLDANVGSDVIYIDTDTGSTSYFKKNDIVYVGPSTDPTRDGSGNQLYYDNYEVFLVDDVYSNAIYIKPFDTGYPSTLQNSFLKGDSVVLRSIARDWERLSNLEFSDISVTAINNFSFRREDSIDDYKNFAQGIRVTQYPVSANHSGIVQEISDARRSLLMRIAEKKIRMSTWMRIYLSLAERSTGNDIDENIGGETPSNDIDEGVGALIDKSAFIDSIDENMGSDTGSTGYLIPSIRMGFYDDVALSSLISDSEEQILNIKTSTPNFFLNKVVTIPAKTMSAKIAAYANFPSVLGLDNTVLLIDDVIAEHCIGTSKEDSGYYTLDMNPSIGLSVDNATTVKNAKGVLGKKQRISVGDPNSRYKIRAKWSNRPGYFINDLRILEAWNREGYPIVLRPKMPNTLPLTMLCNIRVSSNFIGGSLGTAKADVEVVFEEIAV